MEDIATILSKLRATAGFGDRDALEVGSGIRQELPDPEAVAQVQEVTNWAGSDPMRWKQLHTALLRIYAPAWNRVDGRDVLIAWAAARLALILARRGLARSESLRRPLTGQESIAKQARQADVRFWERLARQRQGQVPAALTKDVEAATVLVALAKGGSRSNQ